MIELEVPEFTLKERLGKGSFGEVFIATLEGRKELYAAKRLDREKSEKPENSKRLTDEINILKKIKHPNIVQLIGIKKKKFIHNN